MGTELSQLTQQRDYVLHGYGQLHTWRYGVLCVWWCGAAGGIEPSAELGNAYSTRVDDPHAMLKRLE